LAITCEREISKLEIVRANESHIPEISRLFDLYRQFYGCKSDIDLATKFISDRFYNGESVIFVAPGKDKLKGFVQLYPSFCSVDAVKIFILYDLYVDERDRKFGIGELLMRKATEFSKAEGASRIDLLTAMDNRSAQHLYEKLGYKRDLEDFFRYSLRI
jgi:ribosomal protein S18 acetylase RimI-like enzyme